MRTYTVDDLLNVNQFTSRCPWDISPDGGLLAVTLSQGKRRVRSDANYGGPNGAYIVLIDVETGESIAPFSNLQLSWAGRWSPDGQTLAAYVVAQGAHALLGLWNRQTREVSIVTNAMLPRVFNSRVPQWTPEGHRIIVPLISNARDSATSPGVIVRSYAPEGPASDQYGQFLKQPDFDHCVGVLEVNSGTVTEFAHGLGAGTLRMAPDGQALATLNVITSPVNRPHVIADVTIVPFDGREPFAIAINVPVNTYACRFSWSPDCRTISYITGGKWGDPQHLYCVPADGSAEPTMMTRISSSLGNFQIPWWSDDGTRIIWLQDGCLFNLSIEDGRSRKLSKDSTGHHLRINAIAQRHGESVLHTDDRGDILAQATDTREGLKYIVRIHSASGEMTRVCPAPLSSPDDFTHIASKRFVYARGRVEFDEMVHVIYLESGETKTLLETNSWRRDVTQPVRKTIEFRDANGRVQKAALYLPNNTLAEGRLPMVVTIYPGSDFSNKNRYHSEAQLLTNAGYAALYPDCIMEDDNPIDQIVSITLSAVNRATAMGFSDKDRIGVWGHSYGAYGVMALVTHTKAFRVAIANAPYGVNMTSTYLTEVNGMSWCEGKQARNGGSLREERDAYIENSPLFAFDQIETPVLVMCGTHDVPGSVNARETFLGLRRLGKRVEMREYKHEDHIVTNWSAADTRDYYTCVLDWFDQYLQEEQ